ncbi:hypothetical protein SAMN05216490_2870 [Mucilaginibacter mallensis]|uniref:Uncharacterized protein n=1 Tax=Mucilaginibacter mallensis TaxID=652787 RepID=A0A1H1YVS7_MUCMA|nr:hypothetical protein [Mucilaginibacter mallensis]SDT25574.1 hypothetical protein SAMN05216490_2870 [Mucilaginibacter mallensis]
MKTFSEYNLDELSLSEMRELNGGTVPGNTLPEKVGYAIGHGIAAVVNVATTLFFPWV